MNQYSNFDLIVAGLNYLSRINIMTTVIGTPNKNNEILQNNNVKNKKHSINKFLLSSLFWGVKLLLLPLILLISGVVSKVCSYVFMCSLLMSIAYYSTSGVTKHFLIMIFIMFISVIVKGICNKKGR